MRVVLDSNVLVSALRSRSGASYSIVAMIPERIFTIAISQPLYLEYREVLLRPENRPPGISEKDVEDFVDHILLHAETKDIHFLWRPALADAADEMVLDVAVAFQADFVVTYNKRDFRGLELFGIECLSPGDFLGLVRDS